MVFFVAKTPNPDGSFLVPQYTLREGDPMADVVWSMLDQLPLTKTRKDVRQHRFNALVSFLHGINRSEQHSFYTTSNPMAWNAWRNWPIPFNAFTSTRPNDQSIRTLLVQKGWILVKSARRGERKANVYSAPPDSPMVLREPFSPVVMDWEPPVLQVRYGSKMWADKDEKSKYLHVEYMTDKMNRIMLGILREEMEEINAKAVNEHDVDVFPAEFTGWRRTFRGPLMKEREGPLRGGRLWADYMAVKKSYRSGWSIDDEELVQIDVASCGPTILASLRGQADKVDGLQEVYRKLELSGLERSDIKKLINTTTSNGYLADNSRSEDIRTTIGSLSWAFVRGILDEHVPFLFMADDGENQALLIQRAESDWLIRVLSELLDEGIGVIHLHDAILVPRSKVIRTRQIMRYHFYALFGIHPEFTVCDVE